jgi:hypothetical protein
MTQLFGVRTCPERWLSVLAACTLLVSCGSDDVPEREDNDRGVDELGSNGGLDDDEAGLDDDDLGNDEANVAQRRGKPSGAQVRVVNVYAPLDGNPGPVDVYGLAWSTPSDDPLVTIPFEGVSDYFDPGMFGDDGDAFLSFYWDGTSGNGNALISVTATLEGNEVLTYVIATGGNEQDSGRRYASLQTFDHAVNMVPFGTDVSRAGKGQLVVTSFGLDDVLGMGDSNLFISLGDGCTKAVDDEDFSLTSVGPGTSGLYLLDPGAYTVSLHAYESLDQNERTCDNAPLLDGLEIEAVGDQSGLIVIYAAEDGGDVRWMFVPLDDP